MELLRSLPYFLDELYHGHMFALFSIGVAHQSIHLNFPSGTGMYGFLGVLASRMTHL